MEYNVENIRQLAERYFRGETTLKEEAVLKDYFRECGDVPAELEPCRRMFSHWAETSSQQSRRGLALKRQPSSARLRPLIAATAAVAAALLIGAFILTANFGAPKDDMICYVNGRPVTDPQQAEEYALDVIGLINANLQKPAEYLSAKSDGSQAMERMGEMLNMLTAE